MGHDLWMRSSGGEEKPWLATTADEALASFSPDGELIAYVSNASGRYEVYVAPARGPPGAAVSTRGGSQMAWSPQGDRLYYREGNVMMVADIEAGGRIKREPQRLFDGGWQLAAVYWNAPFAPFAVMPDGKHLLMVHAAHDAIPTRIDVVLNWFEELKKKVP